ncbi:MAG: DUF4349 domain-containing protein [Chloroflexi bacterium]|nr:DUF4349 domain-containing protein [Chloroflexota bacterium]
MDKRLSTPFRHAGIAIVSLLVLVLAACSAARPAADQSAEGLTNLAQPPAAPEEARGAAVSDTTFSDQATTRLVVRNADLTLIVQDTQAQMEAVNRLATELNGYVSSSSTQKYEEGLQARLTLRVPVEAFNTALERLHKLAVEVRAEQISGEDVTAEYTDLTSRLKNLESAEAQLRSLMEKAEKTEDVLAVFNQLTQIRGEIEQIKGRMQYLSQSAALATISVTLIPDQLAQPVQVAGWRPEGVAKSAIEALIAALQGLASLAIWLVIVILPVGLIILSPFIALVVILRRRNKRKQVTLPPASVASGTPTTK